VLSSAFSPPHLLIDGGARRLFSIHATTIHRGASLQQQEEEVQTVTPPPPQQQHSIILANDEEFIKPLPDKRQYRAILLPNGLRALLVSSPQTDVEAAALHVQAGHFDDLRPGLAHFHEHMLFLGTQKYPSSEEFESYLSSNGGSSNAYTDMEDTNYYFSITPSQGRDSSALFGALDRFAQFFMAPLFDISMVEKELQAIDSEYRNSITSDSWRNYQLLKSASNPQHPFHKFGCGNYETLSPILEGNRGPRDDLLDFSKTYYKTNNMRLCVVGRASLDVLQTTVEQTFGNLPFSDPLQHRRRGAGNKPPSLMDDDDDDMTSSITEFPTEHGQYTNERGEPVRAFDSHNLGMIRETIPLLESRSIKVAFAAPPLDDPLLQESRPYRVFSHILGHESPGSLHALLNNKGWIVGLTSGIGIDCSDFSLFTLTLSLTPEGMKHHHKVLDLVFEWIALLRNTDEATLKAHHDQLRQMADHNFQFRENGDATDFCSSAAELLFDYTYEPAKLLVGPTHAGEYNAKVGRAFLDRMTPEHAIITIINSDFSTMEENYKTEPWYKAKYRDVKMTPQQIEKWSNPPTMDPELHVPALNEYIPTDFTLKCGTVVTNDDDISLELQPPKLILDVHHNLRMWHKMDQYWKVPKTHIRVSLLTPNVYRSPRSMTYNRIYQRVLNDDLNSFVYDASVAGCSYRVACIPSGFRISVNGYSEKLPFLLETVTSRMLSLIEELKTGGDYGLQQKFEKAKANLLRETKNYKLDTPYEVASYNSRLLMEETVWYVDNYIDELEGDPPLTMEECAHVAEECLRGRLKVRTSMYVYCNSCMYFNRHLTCVNISILIR
jgi:insulysin